MHSAGSHATKADALASLSAIEADLRRGAWIDPRAGKMTLRVYAEEWLDQRNDLAFRTKELYAYLLESHIIPSLGKATLIGLAPSGIRSWHANLARAHPSTAAKAYRLLSAILKTAVTDGFLLSSPCKVAGGGVERPAERPVATVREVEALVAAMPEHLRLIVLLATWCQLRRAELLGLRRKNYRPRQRFASRGTESNHHYAREIPSERAKDGGGATHDRCSSVPERSYPHPPKSLHGS